MDSDDFDRQTTQYLADGRRNLKNAGLIENWCRNIGITRSAGRGMLEAHTGVPIGHMGVDCEHSSGGSMQSWDVRDSFVNFYEENCKSCPHRELVNIPNAQPIIDEYISRKKKSEKARAQASKKAADELVSRQNKRKELLSDDPNVVAILNALNHLDAETETTEGLSPQDELEELAKLAPEVWSVSILEHLYLTSLSDAPHRLKTTCAKLLLVLPATDEQKARSCFSQVRIGASNELVKWACENIDLASDSEINNMILAAIYRASRSYGIGMSQSRSNSDLLISLANNYQKLLIEGIKTLYAKNDGHGATTAARAITVLAKRKPKLTEEFYKDVCSWYLRWRSRDESLHDLKDSEIPHLRDAAVAVFQAFPEKVDKYLQDLMEGLKDRRKADIDRLYQKAIKGKDFNDQNYPDVTECEKIAFKRLLWRAIEVVELEDYDVKEASNYFSKPEYINPELAYDMQDALLGAASALEAKKRKVQAEPLVKELNPFFTEMNKRHIITSIDTLREGLIGLAFRTTNGIEVRLKSLLNFFDNIPDSDADLQSAFVSQLHKLAPTAKELNSVLPIYYNALYSEHSLVRYSAAKSIWNLKYYLVRDLPPLMFETLLLQLTDTYVIVHISAVREIKKYLIPDGLLPRLKQSLVNLFQLYFSDSENPDYMQEISRKLVPLLSSDEISKVYGPAILSFAEKQSDMDRAKFAEDFCYQLRFVAGAIPFLIKQLRSEWSLSTNNERLFDILKRLETELLLPYRAELLEVAREDCRENFRELYKWIRLFSNNEMFLESKDLASETLQKIPNEKRNRNTKLWAKLLKSASDFEHCVSEKQDTKNEIKKWNTALHNYSTQEKEKHDRRFSFIF